jgi:hypothetical protein
MPALSDADDTRLARDAIEWSKIRNAIEKSETADRRFRGPRPLYELLS